MRKRKMHRGLWLSMVLTVILIATACSKAANDQQSSAASASTSPASQQASAEPSSAPQKKYKIGFANLSEDMSFMVQVREGIQQEMKKRGLELVVANNNYDGATALANAENFITQKVDGVIEYQTDAQFGNVIMQKMSSNKIPVVAIDIPMPGATFFGADNYKAGYMAGEGLGEQVKKQWGGKIDRLITLELPQSGPTPAARVQGAIDALKDKIGDVPESKITRLDSKGLVDVSYQLVNDVLQTLPKGSKIAIFAITDDAALGAVQSLQAANRSEDGLIVGQNGDANMRKEIMREGSPVVGSTGYFPTKYGEKVVAAIVDILDGKSVPPSIYIDHVFLTKENMKDYYPEDAK